MNIETRKQVSTDAINAMLMAMKAIDDLPEEQKRNALWTYRMVQEILEGSREAGIVSILLGLEYVAHNECCMADLAVGAAKYEEWARKNGLVIVGPRGVSEEDWDRIYKKDLT